LPNKYEVFVNISQHQSDKWDLPFRCHFMPTDQVIVHNIEEKQQ